MRVLIFGTYYCETEEKADLVMQWAKLHDALNPECDLLLVGNGGMQFADPSDNYRRPEVAVRRLCRHDWGHNIGHLARGGQDGWGRDFCEGLQYAIDKEYDYVVHIEGDSLLRRPVLPVCLDMAMRDRLACSVPVRGTKRVESRWAETGLMFFDVRKLEYHDVIEEYNWRDGASKRYPYTPEAKMYDVLGLALEMLPWKTIRDDLGVLTVDNVHEYDWVTHTTPEIYDAFVQRVPA